MQYWEIEGLTLAPGEALRLLADRAASHLGVSRAGLLSVETVRRSLDARKKGQPLFRHTVLVTLEDHDQVRPDSQARRVAKPEPLPPVAKVRRDARIVIVGAGPAGLFAAHRLAQAGLKPIILERGKAVEPRAHDVQVFKRQRVLDPESNFCFGEGGAGTWSDGKLTTRIGDARVRHVFETIVHLGGPPEILVEGKPHLGTNRLVRFLRRFRAALGDLGVVYRFETRAERFLGKGGRLRGVVVQSGETIDCDRLILATGHSARSVLEELERTGVALEAKPFAVGFRVEHPQEQINLLQYGRTPSMSLLPAADYRLTDNLTIDGAARGVYSFCMCPGGVIVPTATEQGELCINGMSHASRASPWANSALVVTVDLKDFAWGGGRGVLAGLDFQRRAERNGFLRGGGDFRAPAQRVSDFVAGVPSQSVATPSFRPGVVATSLDDLYPKFVTDALRVALGHWDRKMRGFVTGEAHLLGVETRTSSPVRILRGENLQSPSLVGLYPVGEGAGYAGGIVSAAVDGVRAADQIVEELS